MYILLKTFLRCSYILYISQQLDKIGHLKPRSSNRYDEEDFEDRCRNLLAEDPCNAVVLKDYAQFLHEVRSFDGLSAASYGS